MATASKVSGVYCKKCGIKHSRPVGSRCKRLDISAPLPSASSTVQDAGDDSDISTDAQVVHQSQQSVAGGIESKLDMLLKRMDSLEQNNLQIQREVRANKDDSKTSKLAHSSPNKKHKCSRVCTHKKKSDLQAAQLGNSSDSDDDFGSNSHSHNSLSRIARSEASVASHQPSAHFLRTDDQIQKQVQKQLERLQGTSRQGTTGNKFKSGLLRAGDNAVQQEISWPHHHCFPGPGGQLPDYKDLSPLQFMVGFLGCIEVESSNTIRSNMLQYGRHLFQDALETNWATAKHAHLVLLQDIERGRCNWRQPDLVEKVRIRNTARIITPKGQQSQASKTKHNPYVKICKEFNANSCSQPTDHILDGCILKHACSFCHQEVGRFCQHKVQDCIRRRGGGNSNNKQNS